MNTFATDPIFFEIDPDCPDPAVVGEAGRRLRAGGVIAHPSDTVYGFAAAARHTGAVARMREMKGLPVDRPVIVLVDEPGRIDALVHSIRRYAVDYMATFWPGPLTLILNARPEAPCRAPDGSVALRCPAQPLTRALVGECAGLMASTSANPAKEPLLSSGREIGRRFGDGLAMILVDPREGTTGRPGTASTIVDCRGEVPVLIREGVIPARELKLDVN